MAAEESMARRGAPRASYGRQFRLYATGQAVSVVGDRIGLIALVFLVIHLSKSYAPALALFYVVRVLPMLAGGLLAGVMVDHFDRRRLLLACDLGRAVVMAATPVVTHWHLVAVYPIVLLLYGFTVMFNTSARAMLPDVVPEERMMGANAVLKNIDTTGDFAYVLGGILVFTFQLEASFYIDALTFLFSAATVYRMSVPIQQGVRWPDVRGMGTRIREGIDFLQSQPFLKWSTVAFAVAPFAGGAVFVLAPLYATSTLAHGPGLIGPLRNGAFRFSVLEVATGAGALLGSSAVAWLAARSPRGRIFGVGLVGMGLVDALLALVHNLYVAAVLMAISGLFNSLFVVTGMTLVQTLTPSDMRGRVVAARLTVVYTALAVGSAVGGVMLLRLSYSSMWLVMGAMVMVASLFVWLQPEARNQI